MPLIQTHRFQLRLFLGKQHGDAFLYTRHTQKYTCDSFLAQHILNNSDKSIAPALELCEL